MKCRTYHVECIGFGGALVSRFLIAASNFRQARMRALDYLAEHPCKLLPVEMRVSLKVGGWQLADWA